MDEKLEMFMNTTTWEKAVAHCVRKGIKPAELAPYTEASFRAYLAESMSQGNYRVAPPHIALIPKEGGEFRKVYVNTVLDRLVLTIINEVYSTMYADRIHPNCVSYQKGIGVGKIVKNITGSLGNGVTGYKIDISKYFDSVSRETMNDVLASVDTGSCLDKILYEYYNDDLILDENGKLITKYKSLCQGCAPSAFFANLTLRDVDDKLSSMVDVYYRYSDDLLILGSEADKALKVLDEMLAAKGLHVNPKKIKRVSGSEWFTFLGCNIRGQKVSLSKKSLDNYTSKVKEICKNSSSLRSAINKLNNYLYLAHIQNSAEFGWAEYFFSIINCEEDIKTVDTWTKDMLRGLATGKGSTKKCGGLGSVVTEKDRTIVRGKGRCVSTNLRKTEGLLEKSGYVSMHHLWKCYRMGRDIYRAEINRLA